MKLIAILFQSIVPMSLMEILDSVIVTLAEKMKEIVTPIKSAKMVQNVVQTIVSIHLGLLITQIVVTEEDEVREDDDNSLTIFMNATVGLIGLLFTLF